MQLENQAFMDMRVKRFVFLCWFTYVVILLYVTLFTHNYYTYGRSVNLQLFDSIELMLHSGSYWLFIKNVYGNILLFLPQGLLLPILFRKCRNFFLLFFVAVVSSFTIESLQYAYAKRIFDIDDILLNVVGAIIGWALVMHVIIVVRLLKK
ncbi:MAG TPA: VanZ family protein [Bacillales bacterium]|nr:VanZ family protein [Bacillales bacterium]